MMMARIHALEGRLHVLESHAEVPDVVALVVVVVVPLRSGLIKVLESAAQMILADQLKSGHVMVRNDLLQTVARKVQGLFRTY